MSPGHKRQIAEDLVSRGKCTERAACRHFGLHRSTFAYEAKQPDAWLAKLNGLGSQDHQKSLLGIGIGIGQRKNDQSFAVPHYPLKKKSMLIHVIHGEKLSASILPICGQKQSLPTAHLLNTATKRAVSLRMRAEERYL